MIIPNIWKKKNMFQTTNQYNIYDNQVVFILNRQFHGNSSGSSRISPHHAWLQGRLRRSEWLCWCFAARSGRRRKFLGDLQWKEVQVLNIIKFWLSYCNTLVWSIDLGRVLKTRAWMFAFRPSFIVPNCKMLWFVKQNDRPSFGNQLHLPWSSNKLWIPFHCPPKPHTPCFSPPPNKGRIEHTLR